MLMRRFGNGVDAGKAIVELVTYLEGVGKVYLDPARPRNGSESPYRAMCRRLAFQSEAEADAFHDATAVSVAGAPIAQAAAEAWARAQRPEHAHSLSTPPALSANASFVATVLERFRDHLGPQVNINTLAENWRDLAGHGQPALVRAVASRLADPRYAGDLTPDGQPTRLHPLEVERITADLASKRSHPDTERLIHGAIGGLEYAMPEAPAAPVESTPTFGPEGRPVASPAPPAQASAPIIPDETWRRAAVAASGI